MNDPTVELSCNSSLMVFSVNTVCRFILSSSKHTKRCVAGGECFIDWVKARKARKAMLTFMKFVAIWL